MVGLTTGMGLDYEVHSFCHTYFSLAETLVCLSKHGGAIYHDTLHYFYYWTFIIMFTVNILSIPATSKAAACWKGVEAGGKSALRALRLSVLLVEGQVPQNKITIFIVLT